MDRAIKFLSWTDWALSSGTLVVGLYLQNWYIVGGGVLGLLVAWYSPSKRIKAAMEKKFLRRTPSKRRDEADIAQADAFYAQGTAEGAGPEAPSPVVRGADYSRQWAAGTLYLHGSPHNLLRPEYLRFSGDSRRTDWV